MHEIIVHVRDEMLDLVIHWQGGDHTAIQVRKNRKGQHRWSTSANVIDLVRIQARQTLDNITATVLSRAGESTARGNSWTRVRVRRLRNQHTIAAYREGERAERGEVTLDEAAAALNVSPSTVRRLIDEQSLPAQQLCKGAPWVIKACDLERFEVKQGRTSAPLPASANPRQEEPKL
jgi:excisionase family DNA binding protein